MSRVKKPVSSRVRKKLARPNPDYSGLTDEQLRAALSEVYKKLLHDTTPSWQRPLRDSEVQLKMRAAALEAERELRRTVMTARPNMASESVRAWRQRMRAAYPAEPRGWYAIPREEKKRVSREGDTSLLSAELWDDEPRARRNPSSSIKAWRAKMREAHGEDWWKDERLKATKPGAAWPRGMAPKAAKAAKPKRSKSASKSREGGYTDDEVDAWEAEEGLVIRTRKFKPNPHGTGMKAALQGFAHLAKRLPAARIRIMAQASLDPVWDVDGFFESPSGPGYISMFDGLYIRFEGKLTQAAVMAAARVSLDQVGGADHRFIEDVYKTKEKVNGLPVWAISTGS